MSFELIFEEKAISSATEFLADDRDGVRQLCSRPSASANPTTVARHKKPSATTDLTTTESRTAKGPMSL